jgi:hypothetical protein
VPFPVCGFEQVLHRSTAAARCPANVIAAEALCGAGCRAYIDFVSSRHKNIFLLGVRVQIVLQGKKQNNKNLGGNA